MAGAVESKLSALGITLREPAKPIANYVPFVRTGNVLTVSGQLCFGDDGKLTATGRLGGGVSIEDGQKAARACALNLLAQVKAALGDLDKVKQVVRLGGFINSAPGFTDGPKVMNGASDLMVDVFGDKGKHARSTVGVAALHGRDRRNVAVPTAHRDHRRRDRCPDGENHSADEHRHATAHLVAYGRGRLVR